MSWLRRVLAVALLLLVFPEAGEAVENAAHFLGHGHGAHAQGTSDQHGAPSREHGCSGTFHLCSCCPAAAGVMARGIGLHGFAQGAILPVQWVSRPAAIDLPIFVPPPRQ